MDIDATLRNAFSNCDVKMAASKGGVLVVLCGLPGAGKTTFSTHLKQSLSTEWCKAVHVEFDEHERAERRKLKQSQTGRIEQNNDDEEEKLKAWRRSRKRAVAEVEQHLRTPCSKMMVVIADDNMYYKSMRHEMTALAGEFNFGCLKVYIETSLSDALKTNRQRLESQRVKEDVVRRMHTKLEPPTLQERHVIYLGSQPGFDLIASNILTVEIEKQNLLAGFQQVLQVVADNPEVSTRKLEFERLQARETTLRNLIHQSEQALCKVVGAFIKTQEPSKRKAASKQAAEAKKRFQSSLKERINSIVQSIGDSESEEQVLNEVRERLANEFSQLLDASVSSEPSDQSRIYKS